MSDNIGDSFFERMAASEDELSEKCIHCADLWYSQHYKNGVCHRCQLAEKLGRKEIEASRRYQGVGSLIFIVLFWLLFGFGFWYIFLS